MKIRLIVLGKIKEKSLQTLIDEYLKRLQPYCKVEVVELSDLPIPERASAKEEEQVLIQEGKKVLQLLAPSDYLVALTLEGQTWDSLTFASELEKMFVRGGSSVNFVIGSSLGLSPEVKKRANQQMAFSALTFPHQLIRLFLLEQIYRAFKINQHETYHK